MFHLFVVRFRTDVFKNDFEELDNEAEEFDECDYRGTQSETQPTSNRG